MLRIKFSVIFIRFIIFTFVICYCIASDYIWRDFCYIILKASNLLSLFKYVHGRSASLRTLKNKCHKGQYPTARGRVGTCQNDHLRYFLTA